MRLNDSVSLSSLLAICFEFLKGVAIWPVQFILSAIHKSEIINEFL